MFKLVKQMNGLRLYDCYEVDGVEHCYGLIAKDEELFRYGFMSRAQYYMWRNKVKDGEVFYFNSKINND